MVVGADVSGSFWDDQGRQIMIESLMGEPITLKVTKYSADGEMTVRYWPYEVTGVLKGGGESAYQVFIPDSDVQAISQWVSGKRINRNKDGYNRVIVRATDSKQVEAMQKAIKNMGFNASSTKDEIREMNRFFLVLQAILGGIGAIALLRRSIGYRQHLEHGDPGADA